MDNNNNPKNARNRSKRQREKARKAAAVQNHEREKEWRSEEGLTKEELEAAYKALRESSRLGCENSTLLSFRPKTNKNNLSHWSGQSKYGVKKGFCEGTFVARNVALLLT